MHHAPCAWNVDAWWAQPRSIGAGAPACMQLPGDAAAAGRRATMRRWLLHARGAGHAWVAPPDRAGGEQLARHARGVHPRWMHRSVRCPSQPARLAVAVRALGRWRGRGWRAWDGCHGTGVLPCFTLVPAASSRLPWSPCWRITAFVTVIGHSPGACSAGTPACASPIIHP
jgi:hypothetical protein